MVGPDAVAHHVKLFKKSEWTLSASRKRAIDACKRCRVQIETIGHNSRDAFIYILRFPPNIDIWLKFRTAENTQ